jgi:hypothetical protein
METGQHQYGVQDHGPANGERNKRRDYQVVAQARKV